MIWAAALLMLSPLSVKTAEPVAAASPEQVEKLDHAIKDVLSQRRYEWRLPPTEDEAQLAQISWMQKMLQEIQTAVADSIQ